MGAMNEGAAAPNGAAASAEAEAKPSDTVDGERASESAEDAAEPSGATAEDAADGAENLPVDSAPMPVRHVRAWCAALLAGALAGALAIAFGFAADAAAALFVDYPALCWGLPLAGIISMIAYRALRVPYPVSTPTVAKLAAERRKIPFALVPAVFVGSCLTFACGGSAGKEGAALQMGAASGGKIGRALGLHSLDERAVVLSGMAGGLSALLGTPIAAAIFAIELIDYRVRNAERILMVFAAAFVAKALAVAVGAPNIILSVAGVDITAATAGASALIALAACLAGVAFCLALKAGRRAVRKGSSARMTLAIVGGLAIAAGLWTFGHSGYSGTGAAEMRFALAGQVTDPYFLGKLVLTAATLAFGFKGGEIMPTMCIGACLGSWAGHVMGIDPALGAAVGFIAMLAACTNCPIAAAMAACEAFGVANLPYYVLVAAGSWAITMGVSLYGNTTLAGDLADRWRRSRALAKGQAASSRSEGRRESNSQE